MSLLIVFSSAYSQRFIYDHNSLNQFQNINENEIFAGKNLKVMFRHASVGSTINNALDCIQGTRTSPKICTEFEPYKFDRRNISFQSRGNSGWNGKIEDFISEVDKEINNYDIFSFKFCYLDALDETGDPCGKPFSETKTNQAWELLKNAYEQLEAKYPDKIFIWWTIPLTQSGQYCTEYLNQKIRNYCKDNNKILFDIADIECYDTLNNHITNQQGWEIAFKPYCGEQQEGAKACHPNWTCSIILAKIFWVMLIDIAVNYTVKVQDFTKHLQIYPNPFNSILNISYQNIRSIEIFNVLGNSLFKKTFSRTNNYSFDLTNLTAGIYFIKIELNNTIFIEKIIKL